jgi:hypothetical protein
MGLQNGIFTERLPRGYMTIQAYQNSGSGTVAVANSPILSPRSPTTTDIVSPAGNPYQLLQAWKNTTTGAIFEYAGGGVWVEVVDSGGGGPITTLTGNTGGAIAPIAGNINILGNAQSTFVGTAGTLTLTQTAGGFPITPFVVGPVGKAGYQTIQTAITAAALAGGGAVYIQPGTYTENLTLSNGVDLVGTALDDVIISGTHLPPATGSIALSNLTFTSATHIFSSAVAGSTSILVYDSSLTCTNGFVYNLANWTGTLNLTTCFAGGTSNGVVTNSGGSIIQIYDATAGSGTGQTMVTSGVVEISGSSIECPWSLATGTVADVKSSEFSRTVTCANNSISSFEDCSFSTGATPSLTQSSSGTVSLLNSSINSSNNPSITGAGAGVITFVGVSFVNNSSIAGTLTAAAGVIRGGNFISQFVVGTAPDAKYQTVQSAITAAAAAGGGTVYVKPGTYTESLTLSDGVDIVGTAIDDVIITGVHTPPASGSIALSNVTLTSPTHIFSSAVAGSTSIIVYDSNLSCTNGFVFNLTNWTGSLNLTTCFAGGTDNGIVTNTGGSAIDIFDTTAGIGTGQTMVTTGAVDFSGSEIACPVNFQTGSVISADTSAFSRTLTFSNNSTGSIISSIISTGATAAITMSSSGTLLISNSTITSSNVPAIAGAGAGVLTLGGVDFTSNKATAGTLTLGSADLFKAGAYQSLSFATASGATPQAVNTRVGAVTFTGVSIAGNATSAFVLQNSTIAGASTIVQYTLVGATTGSALTIQSVVNAAGQSTVTIMNGVLLTTTTADITLYFNVLN